MSNLAKYKTQVSVNFSRLKAFLKYQYKVNPTVFVMIFIVIGMVTLVFTFAYSTTTKSVSINLPNCASTTSVRCYDGAVSNSGNVTFNGSGTTTPPSPTGKFYIVGSKIVDPDGNIFYPMGGNLAVSGNYTFAFAGTGNGHAQDAKNWGWNVVRANMVCTNDRSGLDALIKEYTAQKIVVMVECHETTGRNQSPNDPAITNIMNIFDGLATTYKDNPYVWYNPFNEPFSSNDNTGWLNLQTAALARLRAKNPTGIFVADVNGYGQAVQSLYGANNVTSLGAGKCNVLYSWHAYGAVLGDTSDQTKMDAAVNTQFTNLRNANVPLILGEIGDPSPQTGNDNGTGNNQRAARAAIKFGPQYGYGLQWWHLTGDSNAALSFSLMTDKTKAPWSAALTGTGLSATGTSFWNLSRNKPNLGKFTGNIADSHCN